ncbi:ABC transporter ATP-binding protein [Microbispora sp. CA-102843]|uniref:ABC transporter ATP-binding protein n=1 Tax=Microbispora sp. CA-102843 TaxID=3239952 RepID=UPI003D94B0E1
MVRASTGETSGDGLRARRLRVVDLAERVIVDGLDTHAAPGRVLALTGPSGSGKTTALRAMLGCLPPGLRIASGAVRWQGSPVPAGRAGRRWRLAEVGWLGQDPASALDPRRSVLQQVAEALSDRASPMPADREAAALMERLGLAPELHGRSPGRLSGGQAQRAALARALAGDPPLLVLDEPTSGLDAECVRLVVQAVRRRRGGSACVTVLVTHNPELVAELADDVVEFACSPPPAVDRPVPRRRRGVGGPPVLDVRGLRLDHPAGGPPLLAAADLTLHSGESVALLGPSGSGKSTLLHALAGLHPPAAGTVVLTPPGSGGQPTVLPPHAADRDRVQLRRVQLVGQNPQDELNPAHRAVTAVARPLRTLAGLNRAPARREALRLLTEVGLDAAHARLRPGRLSGGQRQRVCLARALAPGAAVLLADEITSALDAGTAAGVLDLLDVLRAEGLAVLMATHDRTVAGRADRVLFLGAGALHDLTGATPVTVPSLTPHADPTEDSRA